VAPDTALLRHSEVVFCDRKNAFVLDSEPTIETLGQWPKLQRYLDHPQLTPDTNAVERAIRTFVVGRKDWLFSGSPRGAHASAVLYSLVESARANQWEPYSYFRAKLQHLP
jgi:transposase